MSESSIPSGKYLLVYNYNEIPSKTGSREFYFVTTETTNIFAGLQLEKGNNSFVITLDKDITGVYAQLVNHTQDSDVTISDVMLIPYQEGMENWDIPYFEGMTSCKMPVLTTTGKNLFDKTKIIFDKLNDWITGIISDDAATNVTDFIKVNPNTQYTMSFNFATGPWTRCLGLTEPKHGKYVTDANGISDKCYFDTGSKTYTITTSPTTNYLIFSFGKGVEESFQLEQGPTATTYEPY